MEFSLSVEQSYFADTLRRFLDNNCTIADVRRIADSAIRHDEDFWKALCALGWAGLMADEVYGGSRLEEGSLSYLGIMAEETGRTLTPGPLMGVSLASTALSRCNNEVLKQRILPGLINGTLTAAWICSDDQPASSDWICRPSDSGDSYLLEGTAISVEAASYADLLFIEVLSGDQPRRFIVPTDNPGVTVRLQEGLDVTRQYGAVEFKLEIPATDEFYSPEGYSPGDIRALALTLQALETTGALNRTFEFTLEWAFDRYSFGRQLASYQALKHRYADLKLNVEACQATSWSALNALSSDPDKAIHLARLANAYVHEVAPEATQDCVQLHGGIGVTWEHDIHLYLRRVTTNRMLLGKPATLTEVIADDILGERADEFARIS